MNRERIEKKIRNIVNNVAYTHSGKRMIPESMVDGFVLDLTRAFVATCKKEINIALHEQKKKLTNRRIDD